jgi:hypothetical protein
MPCRRTLHGGGRVAIGDAGAAGGGGDLVGYGSGALGGAIVLIGAQRIP